MFLRTVLLCGLILLLARTALAEAVALDERCHAPDNLVYVDAPLSRLATRLKDDKAANVLVLGAGSAAGSGMSSPQRAYPSRLEHWLRAWFPEARVAVYTVAKRGATVASMLRSMASEVQAYKPALVIWQIGASDAANGVPISSFGRDLERGLDTLQRRGIDVVLMDMQYTPNVDLLTNASAYRAYMRWTAVRQEVLLFRRYEVMEHWSQSDVFDFDLGPASRQVQEYEAAHDCVAALLARMIHDAVARAR